MWPSRTVPTHSCATVPVGTTGWWQRGLWQQAGGRQFNVTVVERGAWSVERTRIYAHDRKGSCLVSAGLLRFGRMH